MNKLIQYFRDAKHVDFTKEREERFKEQLDFILGKFPELIKYLDWYYNNICLNPKAFVNEMILFNDLCDQYLMVRKVWVQYNVTRRHRE